MIMNLLGTHMQIIQLQKKLNKYEKLKRESPSPGETDGLWGARATPGHIVVQEKGFLVPL